MMQPLTIRWIRCALCVLAVSMSACASDVLRSLSTNTDEFSQNAAAMVDILWAVDNSGSMAQEQQGLGESFAAFIEALILSGVNYHIGVISTDISDGGRLHTGPGTPPFIDNSTADASGAFLANVKVGTSGSASERGFEAVALAIGRGLGEWEPGDAEPTPVPNANFLRRGFCVGSTCEGTDVSCQNDGDCEDAALFLIFVSDEDDKSFGPVKYYWRLFESFKGPGNEPKIKISAIVGPIADANAGTEGGCYNPSRGSAQPGDRYVDLVVQSGGSTDAEGAAQGIVTSICEDFNESLTALSINAAGLAGRFKLSSIPSLSAMIPCDPLPGGPFCVKVNGTPIPEDMTGNRAGWTYEGSSNAIIFGARALPPPQARILITYQEAPR